MLCIVLAMLALLWHNTVNPHHAPFKVQTTKFDAVCGRSPTLSARTHTCTRPHWCERFDRRYLCLQRLSNHASGAIAGVSQETGCWHVLTAFRLKAPTTPFPPDAFLFVLATSNVICSPTKRARARGRPASRGTRWTPFTTRPCRWCWIRRPFSADILVLLTRRACCKQWPHPRRP